MIFNIQIKVEIKVAFLIFLIVAPPQKLVVDPGATIRDNTVLHFVFYTMILFPTDLLFK